MNKNNALLKLMLVSLTIGIVGCNNNSDKKEEKHVIQDTNIDLVSNGSSNYSIVVRENADENEMFAASEIQYFLELSCGATLPIVNDKSVVYDEENYHISLGQTTLFEDSGLELDESLRKTGYIMERTGNTLLINSRYTSGIYSAVYDMLAYEIDLEIYNVDEFDYTSHATLKLKDFHEKFIPLLDIRQLAWKANDVDNKAYNRRMKFYTTCGNSLWNRWGHTTITFYLPKETYATAHPDWYNSTQTQVCYENNEMMLEMAKQIEQSLVENEDALYVMIGHEDNKDMCECDKCVAAREKYGNYAGQEIMFTNKIGKIVDAWLEANYPGREVMYACFAYQTSENAPIYYDETTGKYELYDKDFEVYEHTMVIYCPIYSDFAKPLNSETNAETYQQIVLWNKLFEKFNLKDRIYVWNYSLYCYAPFCPFVSMGTEGEYFTTYAKNNIACIYDQGAHYWTTASFEGLFLYARSKEMYQSGIDFNDLARDYIAHYYGEGSENIQKLFDYIRAHYAYLQEEKGLTGNIMTVVYDSKFWDITNLYEMIDYVENALKDIEGLKDVNPSRYETLVNRIRREELCPIFLLFYLYGSSIAKSEIKYYYDILVKYTQYYKITATAEGKYNLQDYLDEWKQLL